MSGDIVVRRTIGHVGGWEGVGGALARIGGKHSPSVRNWISITCHNLSIAEAISGSVAICLPFLFIGRP